jgi:hypothetical protein
VKTAVTKYNWAFSLGLDILVNIGFYFKTGDAFTLEGLVSAIIAGAYTWYTSEKARDQGQLEGAAVARSQTLPAAPTEAKPGDPYNF